ncbi:MAG: restriction endonuclease subunit S [Balneola sp.]
MREDWVDSKIDQIITDDGLFKDGDWVESKDQDPNGDVRLIQLADIGDGSFRNKSSRFLTSKKSKELNCTFLNQGDIIIARMPDPLGRATIFPLTGKNVTVVDVAIIRTGSNSIETKYLLYCLNSPSIRKEMEALQSGSTRKRISRKNLAKIFLPIAPLPEQRAIVEKIEKLFSDLDNGIANLKTAQAQLKVYRLSVLSSVMKSKNCVPLSEIIEDLSQGWSPKCINRSSDDPTEWAVIKTSAIQSAEFIDNENKILPSELEPREQHEIKKGDILITRAGPRVRVGICCLVRKTRSKLINCDKVYRIVVNKEKVRPEFLEYSLNAPEHLKKIEKIKSGSSDSGLNLTQTRFLKIEIPLPSLEEQHQIVQEIESRLSVCDKMEESIAESLEKAEALRQSILKKAFEGKLLTEAELQACRQEPDWEPAEKLLQRIKGEKLDMEKAK